MELQSQLSKVFVKKTRKGKVIKLVREKYLREDIGCGYLFGSCVSKVSKLSNQPHQQVNGCLLFMYYILMCRVAASILASHTTEGAG